MLPTSVAEEAAIAAEEVAIAESSEWEKCVWISRQEALLISWLKQICVLVGDYTRKFQSMKSIYPTWYKKEIWV